MNATVEAEHRRLGDDLDEWINEWMSVWMNVTVGPEHKTRCWYW